MNIADGGLQRAVIRQTSVDDPPNRRYHPARPEGSAGRLRKAKVAKEFKTAFIGCGNRAKEHVAGVLAEKRCRAVAVSDPKAEAAESLKEALGGRPKIYTDHRKMLEIERPDLVISCLWTRLHLPVFKDCVDAGVKAVHSEKPMAPTWGECLEMAGLAERSGCRLTFSHQRRFAAGNRLFRRMIAKGRFGKILRMDLYSPPNLLDCGTHTFDQAFSFNAEQPVKWVLGAVDTRKTLNWFDVQSESTAVGTLFYANGVRAVIQSGGPDMDIWGGIRVTGTEGFIEVFWDGNPGQGRIYAEPGWRPDPVAADPPDQTVRMVRDIVDCLAAGRESEISYKRALAASEVIFAFYESVRRQARMDLPLTGVSDNPLHAMLEAGRQSC